MNNKKDVLRPTDATAIEKARKLIRQAGFAALAVSEPDTGFPFVSRVLLATDLDGAPIVLASKLATHFTAMMADFRVSLLTGEPGKGDPMAHARMTTRCHSRRVDRESEAYRLLRSRFLRRHPKAKLYIDFPDFFIFRLEPQSASLNAGFGQAYSLQASDLISTAASEAYRSFNADEALTIATELINQEKTTGYSLTDIDPEGLDLRIDGKITRIDFESPCFDPLQLVTILASTLKKIP